MSSSLRGASASSPHGYQSTGLSACWRRYGRGLVRRADWAWSSSYSKIERGGGLTMSDPKRTAFALQALGLAETFNIMLQAGARQADRSPIASSCRRPTACRPAGGKQAHAARQARPRGRRHAPSSPAAPTAPRAGPSCAPSSICKQLHAQRFKGAEIPLDRVQYNELIDKLKTFFAEQRAARCAWRRRRAATRPRRGVAGVAGRFGNAGARDHPRRGAGGGGGRDVVPHAPAAVARRRRSSARRRRCSCSSSST